LKLLIQNRGGVQFKVRPQGEEILEIKHLRSKAIIEFSPIRPPHLCGFSIVKHEVNVILNQNICTLRDNKNENHLTPSRGFLHLLRPIKVSVRGFLKT
jgi:hypothetical protein